MESIENTKRKKRKTRKCLNEIRQRSRRTEQTLFEKENNNLTNLYPNHKKCFITNERLSLRMFRKTVKSETITRPVLADLKQKPNLKLDKLINGSKVLNTLNSTLVPLSRFGDTSESASDHTDRYKMENSMSLLCSIESKKYEDYNVINMSSQEDKLNDALNVYSSINMDGLSDKSPCLIGAQPGSSSTSTSSHRFHDNFGYNLYEEFISEIPTYLKRTVKTMERDIIKNTKMFLKQLFISEYCYQENGEDLLKCIKSTTKYYTPTKVIVHKPMDYIRLSHVQQHSLLHQSSRSKSTIDESGSFPLSPVMVSSSPNSNHTASPSASPLSVIVNDTPDYSYYPHRLN